MGRPSSSVTASSSASSSRQRQTRQSTSNKTIATATVTPKAPRTPTRPRMVPMTPNKSPKSGGARRSSGRTPRQVYVGYTDSEDSESDIDTGTHTETTEPEAETGPTTPKRGRGRPRGPSTTPGTSAKTKTATKTKTTEAEGPTTPKPGRGRRSLRELTTTGTSASAKAKTGAKTKTTEAEGPTTPKRERGQRSLRESTTGTSASAKAKTGTKTKTTEDEGPTTPKRERGRPRGESTAGTGTSLSPKMKTDGFEKMKTRQRTIPLGSATASSSSTISTTSDPPKTKTPKPKKELPPSIIGAFALSSLPCRETQYDEIWSFLKAGVEERDSRCLYVSGVPGTGKTLVVKAVLKKMQEVSPDAFKYIFVNSLTLGTPERIWTRMCKGLGLKLTVKKLSQMQQKIENFLQTDHLPVILIVDELDQLLDKRQSILYTLLEWTSRPAFRFSFIAIFNTMNLPETALAARNSSRMGFNRVVFAPYTHQELQRIVTHHLGDSKTDLLQDALILLSRKVAGISGDARRAIEIANRTLEIIEANANASGGTTTTTGAKAIQDAFKELFSSPHIQYLKFCSKLEKEVIRRLAAILQASGGDNTVIINVINSVQTSAPFEGNPKWTSDQILAAINRLFATKLVLIETAKPSIHAMMTLGVALENVNYALGLPSTSTHED